MIEAADGVGMTPGQRLVPVELPLAAPVIMAGIRTAAVWTIGIATLSTAVGQTSLGNYIFSGLQTENWVYVLIGCIAVVVLALFVDQLLGLIETGVARRDRRRIAAGVVALAARRPPRRPHRWCSRPQRRLRARREEFLRAIHPGRADGSAHRSGRARPSNARKASARRSSSARSPATRSTPTSTIPARCGPT